MRKKINFSKKERKKINKNQYAPSHNFMLQIRLNIGHNLRECNKAISPDYSTTINSLKRKTHTHTTKHMKAIIVKAQGTLILLGQILRETYFNRRPDMAPKHRVEKLRIAGTRKVNH